MLRFNQRPVHLPTNLIAMIITNNKKEFRFETILEDGEIARLEYRWLRGSMVLMHTIVPASGRKKGVGSELVKFVLDYIWTSNLKVIIYCPFVTKYVNEHPEYQDLIDTRDRK